MAERAMTLGAALGEKDTIFKLDMGPITEALGDLSPIVTPTKLGRTRLVKALSKKFGADFMSISAAKKAIEHFDTEFDFMRKIVTERLKTSG